MAEGGLHVGVIGRVERNGDFLGEFQGYAACTL